MELPPPAGRRDTAATHCREPGVSGWSPSHPAVCPQLEDCTLQVSPSGHYLDLELSLLEQKDDLEAFYEEVR